MTDRTQGAVRPGSRGDAEQNTVGSSAGASPATREMAADAGGSAANGGRAARPAAAARGVASPLGRAPSGAAPSGPAPTSAIPTAAPAGAPAPGGRGGNGGARPVSGGARGATGQPAAAGQPERSAETGRPAKGSRGSGGRGPRRARLQLRNVDTWSALKISLVLSIAFFFVWMVAVGLLYGVLSQLGVFDTLNDILGQLNSASGDENSASEVITPGIVFGGAAVIGAINVILLTALCTVGALMYNLCSDLVGGLEVTLSERD